MNLILLSIDQLLQMSMERESLFKVCRKMSRGLQIKLSKLAEIFWLQRPPSQKNHNHLYQHLSKQDSKPVSISSGPVKLNTFLIVEEIPPFERALNDLITKAEMVPEAEFLEADVFTSPKHSYDPSKCNVLC